jgi:hypothetical protein
MQSERQSRQGAQIPCEPSANCWRRREKYPAESSKMMKLKGFRYPAGYCLFSKPATVVEKEKTFTLLRIRQLVKRVKGFFVHAKPCLRQGIVLCRRIG